MIKKLIAATILVVLLCAMANARIPQTGDNVKILTGTFTYKGTITDIENGFICLSVTSASITGTDVEEPMDGPRNMCLGIGSIIALSWPEEAN